jgi:hypothetical protein
VSVTVCRCGPVPAKCSVWVGAVALSLRIHRYVTSSGPPDMPMVPVNVIWAGQVVGSAGPVAAAERSVSCGGTWVGPVVPVEWGWVVGGQGWGACGSVGTGPVAVAVAVSGAPAAAVEVELHGRSRRDADSAVLPQRDDSQLHTRA